MSNVSCCYCRRPTVNNMRNELTTKNKNLYLVQATTDDIRDLYKSTCDRPHWRCNSRPHLHDIKPCHKFTQTTSHKQQMTLFLWHMVSSLQQTTPYIRQTTVCTRQITSKIRQPTWLGQVNNIGQLLSYAITTVKGTNECLCSLELSHLDLFTYMENMHNAQKRFDDIFL